VICLPEGWSCLRATLTAKDAKTAKGAKEEKKLEIVGDAFDASFHDLHVEIQKEAELELAQAKIGQNLSDVYVLNLSHCLGFDQNFALDHKVGAVHDA
jgi:hypothetical protein